MPVLRKVQCCIHTERGKLTEFEEKVVLEQSDAKITRYLDITGAEGQRFWVEIQAEQGFEWMADTFNAVVPYVAVDGIDLGSCVSIKRYQPRSQFLGPIFTALEGREYVREVGEMFFQFLKLVEEEGGEDTISKSDDSRLQRLGRIEVKMYRSMEVRMNGKPWIGQPRVTKSLESVHEKAIKGRSSVYGVQLKSRVLPTTGLYRQDYTWLDYLDNPYITFIFLYRTKETLISLGLLPTSPTEIMDDGDGDDEVAPGPAKLKQEIEALTAQLNKRKATLKRRYGDESDSNPPPIKRERWPSSAPRGSTTRSQPESVDLTGED